MKIKLKAKNRVKPKTTDEAEESALNKILSKNRLGDDDDSGDAGDDDSSSGQASNGSSWMIKGNAANLRAQERSKLLSGGSRVPTLWLKPGEKKRVRFRDSEPTGIFYYSLPVAGTKRFNSYTQPPSGSVDLFQSDLQLKPRYKAIYEVFDVEGYVSKKTGKTIRNAPKFMEFSGQANEQLQLLREEYGGKLTGRTITIKRSGSGRDTTYAFIVGEKTPLDEKLKAVPRLMDKFAEYYAPLKASAQRIIVNAAIAQGLGQKHEED